MANRPRNVDLGPIYLQVGDEAASQGFTPSGADTRDVVRFQSLMNRDRHEHRHPETSPESLLAQLGGGEPAQLADPGDIGQEVAHLWVGTGLQSEREVRVGLREELLPDTSVRLYESQGRLCIEFTCATNRVADWLDRKLPVLASEMGQRLGRPLELVVSMSNGNLVGNRNWPENT